MSKEFTMRYDVAMPIAVQLRDWLAPGCVQIEIAGSLRRGKSDVHDIELVAQPAFVSSVQDFFGEDVEQQSLLDVRISQLLKAGDLEAGAKNGSRFKQFRTSPGIGVDLFVVLPPAQWGYLFAIRTGPADYSQWLVTSRTQRGARPAHLSAHNGALWEGNREQRVIETPTEAEFFQALGIPMVPPAERVARWGKVNTERLVKHGR